MIVSAKWLKEFKEECESNVGRSLNDVELGMLLVRDNLMMYSNLSDYYDKEDFSEDLHSFFEERD